MIEKIESDSHIIVRYLNQKRVLRKNTIGKVNYKGSNITVYVNNVALKKYENSENNTESGIFFN